MSALTSMPRSSMLLSCDLVAGVSTAVAQEASVV